MFELATNDLYSPKNLRYRATLLPECPYKLILELSANQLESQKITRQEVKKVVEYVRTGDKTLLSVAIKMLNLDTDQITSALQRLEKMP